MNLAPGVRRVAWEVVAEMVELQIEKSIETLNNDEVALVLGVAAGTVISRYKRMGVPEPIAESLYDRIARGLGPRKSYKREFIDMRLWRAS